MRSASARTLAIVLACAAFALAAGGALPAGADPGHGADEPHLQTAKQDDGGEGGGLVIAAVLGGFFVIGASLFVLKHNQTKREP